jgi:acyl carrier protein
MRAKILKIVTNCVNTLNLMLDNKVPINQQENCHLFGGSGLLDSLSLVSLIVAVEEEIESEYGIGVILASEKAMSERNSPFATVRSLISYIESLLNKEVQYV